MSAWVDQMFAAAQAREDGVVRRSVNTVRDLGVYNEIITRAQNNGWHVIETGGQLIVMCHPNGMQIHV